MNSIVPIVFATDDAFAPYCAVSIASLLFHRNLERQYAIYIFYDELKQENIDKLLGMAKENVTIEAVQVSNHIDKKLLYVRNRQTLATYYRFFVAEMLPQYDKLLYLDSDIIILKDIGTLYDYDLKEQWLGGVVIYRNKPNERSTKEVYLKQTMNVSPERYINAGILSVNLKAFRNEKIMEKCLTYVGENRNLRWMDQDVLNAVCKDHILFLPEEWNKSQFYLDEDLKAGINCENVGIIHYLDQVKPWWSPYRMTHLYFYQYALLTPYLEELTATLLKNNSAQVMNAKQEVLQMSAEGKLGPRYFTRCLQNWAISKCQKMKKRLNHQ